MNAKKKTIDISEMKRSDALVALIREGMDMTEAEAYWKEHGSKRATGFRARFYEECLKTDFNKDSLLEYMKGEKASENVINLVNYYLGIASLVTRAKNL